MSNFLNQFPYSDFHELNLDWILKEVKGISNEMASFIASNKVVYKGLWNITQQYENNDIVLDQVRGYLMISIQPVPAGIDILNTDYWIPVSPFKVDIEFDEDSYNAIANKTVTEKFAAVDEAVSDNAEAISAETEARESADEALGDRIDALEESTSESIENLTSSLGEEVTARENADTSLSDRIDVNTEAISNEASARESADNTLSARITAIATLPEGSTSGDAELMDIRVAANGVTYPSAGDSVRAQYEILDNEMKAVVSRENIFDYTTLVDGYFLRHDTGNIQEYAGWTVSDYIPVAGLTTICTGYMKNYAFYDAEKVFIANSGGEVVNGEKNIISIPAGAAYMRIDFYINNLEAYGYTTDTIMVIPNVEALPYKFYAKGVKFDTSFSDDPVPLDLVDADYQDFTYFTNEGGTQYFNGYALSKVIEVKATKYFIAKCFSYQTYDADMHMITFSSQQRTNYVLDCTYNKGIKYFRISIQQAKKEYANGRSGPVINSGESAITRIDDNYWKGKRILWLGTSIPEGNVQPANGYPNLLAERLGCTVINNAVGGSMAMSGRAMLVSKSDPNGLAGQNWGWSKGLTQNLALKNDFITNWNTWKTIFSNAPSELDETMQTRILNSSYENALDPYLTNANRCDLYVLNFGWNESTPELYSRDANNKLYCDWTYQYLADNAANISTLDPYRYDTKTFRGAYNWIIRRILSAQPQASILILGEGEAAAHVNLVTAQEKCAYENACQYIPLWKAMGLNQRLLSVTKRANENGVWTGTSTLNVTTQFARIYDGTHPQGWMANRIADYLEAKFRYDIR